MELSLLCKKGQLKGMSQFYYELSAQYRQQLSSKLVTGFMGSVNSPKKGLWYPYLAYFSESKIVISNETDILVLSRVMSLQDFLTSSEC